MVKRVLVNLSWASALVYYSILFSEGPVSRGLLSRKTGLDLAEVENIMSKLRSAGLIDDVVEL
jgi:DNA-binding IscR family transcriptional regulator